MNNFVVFKFFVFIYKLYKNNTIKKLFGFIKLKAKKEHFIECSGDCQRESAVQAPFWTKCFLNKIIVEYINNGRIKENR